MFSQYGVDYWNRKYPQGPVLYAGRALRGSNDRINVDVKQFIFPNDELVKKVIDTQGLRKINPNDTANACQQFVCDFLTYKYDEESSNCVEYWQFPFETLSAAIGDCEDGAILTANLLINAGVPSWRVKVAAGNVQSSSTAPLGGHAYCLYLADRQDTPRQLEWVILDWCYFGDPEIPVDQKPLAKNGGQRNAYKDLWFAFNNEYSWTPSNTYSVTASRISDKNHTKKMEEIGFSSTKKTTPDKIKIEKCPTCGAALKGAGTCPYCNIDIIVQNVEVNMRKHHSTGPTSCPQCGASLKVGAKSCQYCKASW